MREDDENMEMSHNVGSNREKNSKQTTMGGFNLEGSDGIMNKEEQVKFKKILEK